MSALTPREQRLLVDSLGGADLAGILVDDDGIARLRASWLIGHFRHVSSDAADGPTFRAVESRGITFGHLEPEPVGFAVSEVITWASIRAHRASLPARVIANIRSARDALREHHLAYPEFHRPDDPAAFAEAHIAFQRDAVGPWATEAARLYDTRRRALDAAFPEATRDAEPSDLLGFLAEIEQVPA